MMCLLRQTTVLLGGGYRMSKSQVTMELGLNGASKQQVLFQSAGSGQQRHGSTVSFHNIHYKVRQGGNCLCRKKGTTKDILIDLKFLDVLAARKDPAGLSGEVLIDGAPQPPNFKCLSGYVVQVGETDGKREREVRATEAKLDDVVMGTLTVRENFSFSAALRLPSSVSQEEKEKKVNRLIQELGLSRVADSKVGTQLIRGISGGERKRTNIGMELIIIDPSVLFLDEPTTGLDASTANSVLLLLKRMANNGRTIILSIHQPRYSIYRLFDSLTLLVNGKQVYHAPAQAALEYFSEIGYTCEPHNNPADFFLDIINGDSTAVALSSVDREEVLDPDSDSVSTSKRGIEDKLVEEYRNSHYFKQTKAELERISRDKLTTTTAPSRTITYNTGFFTQFRWVLKRTFRNLMLNPQTSIAQVAVTLFLALVVGAIFFNVKEDDSGRQNSLEQAVKMSKTSTNSKKKFGALFFIVVNQCFSSLSSAELFISERKLFMWILSDIITLRTIPAIIFSCVAYFMIGLKPTVEAFFLFMFSVTLVAIHGYSTSMALAISADQTVVAIALTSS
ncbi:hypothetical protein L3Q82_003831 [Scortum barcoo]|uniref:Uncharacterized protein n=1 Tax=Scortum barcoo TaxID=214431 RepID=A0ACB8X6D4_9TELE|nr:hypothetical protein L3Q82_003831 [Scortum barcoo]